MYKIIGTAKGELPIKRCWLPGLTEKFTCPRCGTEYEREFNGDEFSYPMMNEDFDRSLYCHGGCGHEWSVKLHLEISIKAKE